MRSNLTMANGSPKHYSRDATLDMNNIFSDTSSSSSSTCSDLSIPSCSSSSSIQSGHTSSRMAYSDSESAPSTPRTTPGREGSRSIPRPGKRGAQNSSQKNSQKVVANTPVTNRAYQFSNEAKFELQEDPDFWNDHNVQVLIRTRPLTGTEAAGKGVTRCLRQDGPQTITWLGQPETRFTFDHVAGESITQEDLFRVAGTPMVENCMRGYNSSMFAYGQTGSGKTHTMLGDIDELADQPSEERGMTPRIFEYLFARIKQEEENREQEQLRYICKCSFLEIYNEHIADLLDPTSTNLQIREDAKTGVYVENLKEIEVKGVQDVVQLLIQGAANRKVAATHMNRESSRSHSVFACSIESKWEHNTLTNIRFGRLNLVDLAGSERQKSSGAEGDRLKEAANINKSLSTLGLVIMILVDVANGKQRHVPYRDSKLTFLLQDSLGGNSKTTIISTVSPSSSNALETLSTLKFAQRAKYIRNNAIVNEDASGDVIALRREIQQLKEEVSQLKLQSVSTMQRYEGDPEKPAPGLGSNNLLRKIRAVEATLSGALRREQVSQVAARRYADEIEQLQSLVRQRDQNAQSGKMILRFRDERIHRLEACLAGRMPMDHYLMDENKRLVEEIELVRRQNDHNPELTRFAMDNIRLMEQVRGLKQFFENGERETMIEEISNLRDQLLEMTEAKLSLEQGAIALSSAQADKYRKELEICCNDLCTCLEVNSKLTKQVEELQAQVGQLSARCQEQQQDLDLLKAQPMGRYEELELERAVHLQIIADLKAQLQQAEKIKRDSNSLYDTEKDTVQDKCTLEDQAEGVSARPTPSTESRSFETKKQPEENPKGEEGSLFDEDIEQLQACDEKQTQMETEFETFSELMTQKESLLDEGFDNLEVSTRRQSLESEYEAYAELVAERRASAVDEDLVHQQRCAKIKEMASSFDPYTELMEGESELLTAESLKEQTDQSPVLNPETAPNDLVIAVLKDIPLDEPEMANDLIPVLKDIVVPSKEPQSPSDLLPVLKDISLNNDIDLVEIRPRRLSLESLKQS